MGTREWGSQSEQAKGVDGEGGGSVRSPGLSPPASLFSIGAVTSLTGIPPATLRVWQRRYAFPQALRSPGGHRQFHERDFLRLQWVKMQMDAGMRAGRAIRAQQTMTREAGILAALNEPLPPLPPPDPAVVALQPALLESLLGYGSVRATAILSEAVVISSVSSAVLNLVGPTLAAVGRFWSQGEIEVATEHFATNLLRAHLVQWMRASPPPCSVRPVALACAPGELHEGGLLMLAVLLRQLRWPVTYLGQLVPLTDLPALVEHGQPALIVFAAMTEATAQELANWPDWLPRESETQLPLVGYGGRAFVEHPTLVERVPGTLLGITIDEARQRIHRLMLHVNVLPAAQTAESAAPTL